MMTDSAGHLPTRTPLADVMHSIEQSRVLDPVVAVGNAISSTVVANPVIRDTLKGAWLGHALHPLLIEVPMGTWMSASALDLLGGEGSNNSAALLTSLGVAAAVPAALSGWAEYSDANHRDKRTAVVHAGSMGAGVGLQVASLAARLTGRHSLGAAIGGIAMGVVGAGGYLGGHLAAARKVGSHDPSFG